MSETAHRGEKGTETPWRVKEHDEAKYNFSDEKGVWQPRPEDILSMFEKLAQGNALPLKWTCPGRRPPDKNMKLEKSIEDRMGMESDDSQEDESKSLEASAFDFDEPYVDVNAKLIPKRTPGGLGRTPKTEKRVATMDNIMKSLQKQQLQRVAEREARKTKGSPSTTPTRPRLLNFGTDGSKHLATSGTHSTAASSPRFAESSTASSSRFAGSSTASSPRFAGSSTASTSSPLLNRGSVFMTPARKKLAKSGTNGASADSRAPEVSGSYPSAQQGTSFDSIDNRSEQVGSARDLAESLDPSEEHPSASIQPRSTYASSPAFNNATTKNLTKVTASASFMASTISSSNMSSNITSRSSPIVSFDKESLPTTELFPADSNLAFISISTRTAGATSIPTSSASLTANVMSATDTHHATSVGLQASTTLHVNHAGLGINLDKATSDSSLLDQPSP